MCYYLNEIEEAVSCYNKDFSCSQAIFSAHSKKFGVSYELALKIASAFGGGMARLGDVCGAVTGAFMVIGLKYGRSTIEDENARETTYSLVRTFVEKFTKKNGSIKCKELLKYDLNVPEQREIAKKKNLFKTLCPLFVRNSAEILNEIL